MKYFLSEFKLYLCNNIVSILPSHIFRIWFYSIFMKFKIGIGSSILMKCEFDSSGGLIIGVTSVINAGCRIDTRGGITIGNNVSISRSVNILTADHDMNDPSLSGRLKPVKICDYAWIGTGATIMPGVVIGRGAVVAAGAVVTRSVDAFNVVAGVPARVIKGRRSDVKYIYQASYRRLFQ